MSLFIQTSRERDLTTRIRVFFGKKIDYYFTHPK